MVTFIPLLLAAALGSPAAQSPAKSLQVGDSAPAFKLKLLGKNEWFELGSNLGKRPTVLVFGSYT